MTAERLIFVDNFICTNNNYTRKCGIHGKAVHFLDVILKLELLTEHGRE